MKHHSEVINYIIEQRGYTSYLEIGIHNSSCFDRVRCKFKIGVDPDPRTRANYQGTSDEFFEVNNTQFDIVFIDGLHQWEQVCRDYNNAVTHSIHNSVILIHDTAPSEQRYARFPRDISGRWNGDVYKMLPGINNDYCTVDLDGNGLTIVKDPLPLKDFMPLSWKEFNSDRTKYLRPTKVDKMKEWIRVGVTDIYDTQTL